MSENATTQKRAGPLAGIRVIQTRAVLKSLDLDPATVEAACDLSDQSVKSGLAWPPELRP